MKKFASLFLTLIMLLSCTGCEIKSEWFTEEEHIQRVTERVEERYADQKLWDGNTYESYEVYPLYNENEELTHFLVEFEPYGFIPVTLFSDEILFYKLFRRAGMYRQKTWYINTAWSPYNYNYDDIYPKKEYFLDKNGEQIYYNKSPYYIADCMHQRKYVLRSCTGGHICAIKDGDVFINLMNGATIDIAKGDLEKEQPSLSFTVYFSGDREDNL